MEMEELIRRLEESGDIKRRNLQKTIKRKYSELENSEDIECRVKSFEYLNGCINTMLALGEISESEENGLWHEMFRCIYGEEIA